MRIKYKLILLFIAVICAASLPLSLFTLAMQESEKITAVRHQGIVNTAILARSVSGILLTNGGDIESSRLDASDMMKQYRLFSEDGLVYADAVILSGSSRLDGTVIAQYRNGSYIQTDKKIIAPELQRLRSRSGFELIDFAGAGPCYEFVMRESVSGNAQCAGRMVFSRKAIIAPLQKMRFIVFLSSVAAVFLVSLLAIVFSRLISRPVYDLIDGVQQLESGNYDIAVKVRSHDEMGKLAVTFNHLARILHLQITELQRINRELRRADQIKDEFMANVSHELRSPLYGMIGIAESVIDGAAGEVSGEIRHDLLLVVQSGRRLTGLINDILDFSRMRHRDLAIVKKPVDMYSIMQGVIALMSPLVRKKEVFIHNQIGNGSVVIGDENRIQQILLNVVGNALKFTEKGEIVITSHRREREGMIDIVVSDTGIGIPRDRIHRIFESFEQADGSISRSYGGTGLGLAITKSLVELHGGKVWAESEEGCGSAFHILLPAAPDDAETLPHGEYTEGTEAVSPLGKNSRKNSDASHAGTVLVVDDEPVNIQILINQLTLAGYDVLTSSNGYDALRLLETAVPDIILLDIMMPKISGFEVCRIIREKHKIHDLPVIMLTAKSRPEDVEAGLEAGANDYLVKPVQRQELLARVGSLLSLKRSLADRDEFNMLKRDMQIAHEIQHFILSNELPQWPGADIAVRYVPMYELGGDFYEIRVVNKDELSVLIADVSGHGIPAALLCAMLKVTFSFFMEYDVEPGVMMEKINTVMARYTGNNFITASYAVINTAQMRMTLSSAGHWPVLVQRGTAMIHAGEGASGIPIGWMAKTEYECTSVDLCGGDRIVFYTDCFVDARNSAGEIMGLSGFEKFIGSCRHKSADAAVELSFEMLSKWAGPGDGRGLPDDATIIILDVAEISKTERI